MSRFPISDPLHDVALDCVRLTWAMQERAGVKGEPNRRMRFGYKGKGENNDASNM